MCSAGTCSFWSRLWVCSTLDWYYKENGGLRSQIFWIIQWIYRCIAWRERGNQSHLPICLSVSLCVSHARTHRSMSYWPLTLTLLFLCFLVETGQGGGAASEGTCMARRSDGKVGHLLLSLPPSLFFLVYRPIVFPFPSVFQFPLNLAMSPYFPCNSLMTMWSASQRQCDNKT